MNALLALVLTMADGGGPARADGTPSPVGKKVQDFKLRDYRGAERSLADFANRKALVIAFLGCECPLAKLYGPRLVELAKEYEAKGVAFVGINSNQQDSATDIGHYAKAHGISFPILKDVGNTLADQLGALRTPEVFVLDAERVVRYWGRVDDQYGIGFVRPKPEARDLAAALDDLLAGKAVRTPKTEVEGCHIGRVHKGRQSGEITYAKHVAPVLQKHCIVCHREGQIAPFALTTYDDVVGWTATIEEVVRQGRMPPWHADPKYGKFSNDARLSDADKKIILDWIENGAPEGDSKDLPQPISFPEGWRIPKPDVVIQMPKPFRVPAQGDVPYQFIVVDSGFIEDKWIQASEVKPSCRSVVHHILVFVQPPGAGVDEYGGFAANWVAAMAPGSPALIYPEGTAKLVPAGSRFVFQIHYTPDGSEKEDQSCLGLVFADPKSVRKEVSTQMAAYERFEIPPHHPNYKIEASRRLRNDSILLEMLPHTHVRGKAFRYEAVYPDGKREILLDLPRYDFNWQNRYLLAEPKLLPKGTTIHCTAYYDNSKNNRSNPDPDSAVRWGDQTWEEMMIGYFSIMRADEDLQKNPRPAPTTVAKQKPALQPELKALAGKALQSDEAFDEFAAAVRKRLPQVDRLCYSTINGGILKMERASYPGDIEPKMAPAGFESQSRAFALGYLSLLNRTTVLPDLSKAFGLDLKQFSKTLGSSVHVPVALDGKPGTINFWSREKNAFGDDARELAGALGDALLGRP
jgi:peroxiredoxin